MLTKICLLILLISLCYCKLHQVISVFRHGARYHLNTYYDGNSTFNQWGQLTPVGMRQHQNLGKKIAKDYIQNLKFLNPKFDKKQVQIYSTDFNRTIISGLSHMYGIYPPGNGPQMQKVQQKYHFAPFSTNQTDIPQQVYSFPYGHQHIMIKFNSTLMLIQQNCPNLQQLWKKNYQRYSAQYEQMNMTYRPFLKKMISMFNLSSNATFQTTNDLYDSLVVDRYLGRPLPSNFTMDDFNNLEHLYNWLNNLKFSNTAALVFNSRKYEKILNQFDKRIQNLNGYPLKWTFLSAHDTDILPMQTDLNFSSFGCVEDIYRKGKSDALNCQNVVGFASSLIFELHSDNEKDFYVMVRAQGKYMNLCQKQSTRCEYVQFKNRMKKSIVNNVEQICGASPRSSESNRVIIESKKMQIIQKLDIQWLNNVLQ